MLFNSLTFAIFLFIVFIIYWIIPHKFRWFLLLTASYYFYACCNPKYMILILISTTATYISAILLEREENQFRRKAILVVTLMICLGLLFLFKYFNFFLEGIVAVFGLFSIRLHPVTMNILLPLGISFYTFQSLGYLIDVYRGKTRPEHHFGIYATFISFFPQLVSGPIGRAEILLPQIKSKKDFYYDGASYGLKLMAWGFFKKLAISDVLAKCVDASYSSLQTCSGFDLLIVAFFFTIQIYCDFSGYSDIVIGTSKLLGIDLMINFKSPYFSMRIKEFWRR